MKRLKIAYFFWGIILMIIILLLSPGVTSATSIGSGEGWTVISSPSPGPGTNSLSGAVALSENNVWAVGGYTSGDTIGRTLIEHWNGSEWKVVVSPNSGTNGNYLYGISAVSASNLWAVGEYGTTDSSGKIVGRTLIEHWNGFKWRTIASPNNGLSSNALNGLVALSSSNIWAVGEYLNTTTGTYQTLIEHWNGSRWGIVPSPNPGTNNHFLHSVAAASVNDIWAVGEYSTGTGPAQVLIEHWNGLQWKVIATPPVGTGGNYLNGVAAISANDAWAVGNGSGFAPLVEHWDGKQWKAVTAPTAGTGGDYYTSVTAISAHNVWAAGYYFDSNGIIKTLIAHWSGTKWGIVSSPNPGSHENLLAGLTGISDGNAWAVGLYIGGNGISRTLIESTGE